MPTDTNAIVATSIAIVTAATTTSTVTDVHTTGSPAADPAPWCPRYDYDYYPCVAALEPPGDAALLRDTTVLQDYHPAAEYFGLS